jgi:hypothetical protein
MSDESNSSRSEEDAAFLGWQENPLGENFPLFTITAPGHPLRGSTVSDQTLRKLNLHPPDILRPEKHGNEP